MDAAIWLIVIILVVVGILMLTQSNRAKSTAAALEDAKAEARQSVERLGGQVYMLNSDDPAARQALADASERLTAATAALDQAQSPPQARLARQTANEGLYYIRAARTAMGIDPGPAIPELDGQQSAGSVTENREIDFEGRRLKASPDPSAATPNYYPGGRVAGRPVPAGWYSEPWWKPALVAGAWGVGSMMLFSAMFSGMAGVNYDAAAFESGAGDGSDMGDMGGDFDGGGDFGGDFGGGDFGGDFGGGDFGGF